MKLVMRFERQPPFMYNLMPLNNKVYGIQDEETFKSGSHRTQELFFSTRSGAVYHKHSKDQKLAIGLNGQANKRHKTKKNQWIRSKESVSE